MQVFLAHAVFLTRPPVALFHPDVAVVLCHAGLWVQEGHTHAALSTEAGIVAATVFNGLLIKLLTKTKSKQRGEENEGERLRWRTRRKHSPASTEKPKDDVCVCVSVCVHVCLCVCVFFLHCGIKKMHTAHKLMGTFSNVGTAFLSPMSFFEGYYHIKSHSEHDSVTTFTLEVCALKPSCICQ